MASPVTLGSMLTSVYRRANIENLVADTGTVISTAEVREYLNEALYELYDLLVQARGQEFFRKQLTFNVVPYQPLYPLPPDFYECLSCDIYLAPSMVITALPYQESERNMYRLWPSWGWLYTTPVRFRLQGVAVSTGANLQPPMINFIPGPSGASQVTIWYYPAFRPFATDGTEDSFAFDGVNGWEAYAVWAATAVCLEKLEQNSEYALAQVNKYRERIEAMAPDRHAGHPEKVQDVLTIDVDPWSRM